MVAIALFIVLGAAAAVAVAGRQCSSDTEVLILGAGIAGIAAAKTLSEGKVTDFLILEAQDKIGGRVKNTVFKSGVRVELGANWIQGIDPAQPEKHPLWEIAQKCGGLGGRYYNYSATGHVFDQDGHNITENEVFLQRLMKFHDLLNPGLALYTEERQEAHLPDVPVRTALEHLGWFPHSPTDKLIDYMFDLEGSATPPERTSLYGLEGDETYSSFGDPDNTRDYYVTDQEEGFVKVVHCLAKDFLSEGDSRLHLESTVVEVDWTDDQCVCVTTREHSTLREYCAPHVILTFSLGVLKSDTVKFVPDLPEGKRNAIAYLDFVLYLKIFLEFKEIFWEEEAYVDSFFRVDPTRGHFVQFQPLTKTAPVLFTTVTGDIAKMVYQQPIENTTSQIMRGLQTIYGQDIPDPTSVTIPDWWVNPLFQGTYSNIPPGFGGREREELRAAVSRLHFAGEATSTHYFGYVHGGYFSGRDVAEQVLRERNKTAAF